MPVERQENCAVVFADMSGSTKLYVDVGDERARVIVAETLASWSGFVVRGGGQVVQLRGDGMLCTFPTIDAALAGTIRMRDQRYPPALSMHAGIHVGPVLQETEQLYGDTVNVAARMADIAKRFEIVLSAAAFAQLEKPSPSLRLIKGVAVKGKSEPMNIYLLPSPGPMVTEFAVAPERVIKERLRLQHGEQTLLVDAVTAICLIGRDAECLLKVHHGLVSRRHASIEFRAGRFFLQDHSTNGTYVDDGDGAEPARVCREIYQLKGRGVISLGVEPRSNPYAVIRFSTLGDD